MAVVTTTHVEVLVTATNTVMGSIPVPGGVRDAAAVPGTHKLAIAHATGISIVDLDTMTATTATVVTSRRRVRGDIAAVYGRPGPDLVAALGIRGR